MYAIRSYYGPRIGASNRHLMQCSPFVFLEKDVCQLTFTPTGARPMRANGRRHPCASEWGVMLGRCQSDAGDVAKLHALPRFPKIMVVLHGEPAFGRATQGLRQPQRHFRAHAASSSENAVRITSYNVCYTKLLRRTKMLAAIARSQVLRYVSGTLPLRTRV